MNRGLAACALLVFGLAIQSTAQHVGLRAVTGVNFYTYWNQAATTDFQRSLSVAATLSAGNARIPISFGDYLVDPTTTMSITETCCSNFSDNGYKPIVVANMDCPDLADSTKNDPWPTDSTRQSAYVTMVGQILAFSTNPLVEVGSEPNLDYTDISKFATYFDLVKMVGAANPSTGRLVGPGVTTFQSTNTAAGINFKDFLQAFNTSGAGAYMSSYSVHAYGNASVSFTPEVLYLSGGTSSRTSLPGIMGILSGKPLLVTETGADTESLTEDDQASRIVRAILCADQLGVGQVDLYELRDHYDWGYENEPYYQNQFRLGKVPRAEGPDWHFGLTRSNLSAKPAFRAVEKLLGVFGGYHVQNLHSDGPNLWSATMQDDYVPGNIRYIYWASTPAAATLTHPYNPVDSF